MSSCSRHLLLTLLLTVATAAAAAGEFAGIGREATAAELRAWDTDVRADFLGLPPGSGSVEQGRALYAVQCASCHGIAGESDAFFTPLIGGTTQEDMAAGRVAGLVEGPDSQLRPTMFMKLATLSTLFDYIQRAMPWTTPKTLAPDQVYALVAYLLNLADIVPADFILSAGNIAEVQKRLPNRYGMTTDHGLWPGAGMGNGSQPDVSNKACMRNCASDIQVIPARGIPAGR